MTTKKHGAEKGQDKENFLEEAIIWLDEQPYPAAQNVNIYAFLQRAHPKPSMVLAVLAQGKLLDLREPVKAGMRLSSVTAESEIGAVMLERTLSFVFVAAIRQLFPAASPRIEHGFEKGLYAEIDDLEWKEDTAYKIEERMNQLIAKRYPIERRYLDQSEAAERFEALGMADKAANVRHRQKTQCAVDRLCGVDDYFYGHLCMDTSYLSAAYVKQVHNGVWFGFHPYQGTQEKLFSVCDRFECWGRKLSITNVPQLNARVRQKGVHELILLSEAMIERKLVELCDQMNRQLPFRRFILISGPSSAGKTTFSRRLETHLRVLGYEPHALSMDDFFHNRSEYPKLADGTPDMENIAALDVELLHHTVSGLLKGKAMPLPSFDFKSGTRQWNGAMLKLGAQDILIMEGIHGLNPQVSGRFAKEEVFCIYVNALTHLNLDAHTRIPTGDYRLIRRLVRDYQFRGYSAADTLRRWKHVRDGEDRYIYPYQEQADAIFNTSMVYEMMALKKIAVPLLEQLQEADETNVEARRLLSLLQYFDEADCRDVPNHSILAEFVGNSVFFTK